MIRILQCVNDMHRAGLETMLMNYYRNIDRSKIQFDFLTHRPNRSDYDDEIESMGGKIYYAPRLYPQNYPTYFKYMAKFFEEHPEYKIVHSHIDSMSYLPLLAAKKAGVPVRIAHSHNTSIDKDFKYLLKQLFRFGITSVATDYCACGQEAGRYLFGNRAYTFIPNAIDSKKFLFNAEVREKRREEFHLQDAFVVGHIGRLSYQKNHKFLVEIFAKLKQQCPNAILALVGVGEKEADIKAQVKALGLTDSVMFLGNRSDVNELYQMMDVFVMPSHFEGVPVVGIEAQFAGLPCIFSDKVPVEVKFTDCVRFISLDQHPNYWADEILKYRDKRRSAAESELQNSIYDIRNSADGIMMFYRSFIR